MTHDIIVLITTLNYETRSDIFEVKIINHKDLLKLITPNSININQFSEIRVLIEEA